jgi:hypothetical protein
MINRLFIARFLALFAWSCRDTPSFPCGPEMKQRCTVSDDLLDLIDADCKDNNHDGCFSPLTNVSNLNLNNIQPAEEVLYFEIREVKQLGTGYTVVNKSGELCTDSSEPELCIASFEALHTEKGFGWHDHPADLTYYLAVEYNDKSTVIDTVDAVMSFLGTVETAEEAILLAVSNEYFISEETGGIRQVSDGFELILYQLVSLCTPIQIDRVWIHIDIEGKINEIDREIDTLEKDFCS